MDEVVEGFKFKAAARPQIKGSRVILLGAVSLRGSDFEFAGYIDEEGKGRIWLKSPRATEKTIVPWGEGTGGVCFSRLERDDGGLWHECGEEEDYGRFNVFEIAKFLIEPLGGAQNQDREGNVNLAAVKMETLFDEVEERIRGERDFKEAQLIGQAIVFKEKEEECRKIEQEFLGTLKEVGVGLLLKNQIREVRAWTIGYLGRAKIRGSEFRARPAQLTLKSGKR